jgi:hypothetical protein
VTTTSANIATTPMGFLVNAAPPWPYDGSLPQEVPLEMIKRERKRKRVRVMSAEISEDSDWKNVEVEPGVWNLTSKTLGLKNEIGVWRQAFNKPTFFPLDGSGPQPNPTGKNDSGPDLDADVPEGEEDFEDWSKTDQAKQLLANLKDTLKRIRKASVLSVPVGAKRAVKLMIKGIESGKEAPFRKGQGMLSKKVGESIEEAKRPGPRSSAQTPSEPDERIGGSEKNAPGTASTSGGEIEVSQATRTALQNMIDSYVESYPDAPAPSMGQLLAVYRRGAGAFSKGHRPGKTRAQWAYARVQTFLKMLRGAPVKKSYREADSDLLSEAVIPPRDPAAFLRAYQKKLNSVMKPASSFTDDVERLAEPGSDLEYVLDSKAKGWRNLDSGKVVDAIIGEVRSIPEESIPRLSEWIKYSADKAKYGEVLRLAKTVTGKDFERAIERDAPETDLSEVVAAAGAFIAFDDVLTEMIARSQARGYGSSDDTLNPQKVERLYHVSINAKEIKSKGFNPDMPSEDSGLGLGGSQAAKGGHKGISFTYDKGSATQMYRMLRELHAVANGKLKLPQILDAISRAKNRDDVLYWINQDMRVDTSGEGEMTFSVRGRRIPASKAFDTPEKRVQLYYLYLLHGGDRPKIYVMQPTRLAKTLSKTRLGDIGIVVADVNMVHPGVSYHSGEREYRVPPEAVLKISELIQ